MKRIKKLAAAAVACILMLTMSVPAFAATEETPLQLQFDENGKFKILVLSDLQDTDEMQKDTYDLMIAALDTTKPDFVVLLGDNIGGWWRGVNEEKVRKAIDNVAAPINERKIPFALVFGNHDHESGVSREDQMKIYQQYEYCMAVEGPSDIAGCGNYNLLLKNSAGDKDIFNLWFFDSHSQADEEDGGYGYVKPDQVAWYEKTAAELTASNGGVPIPAFAFQHIVVPEVYQLFDEVPKGTKGAIRGHGKRNDKYYVASDKVISGELREGPCCSNIENNEFSAWKAQGDVIGAFFGHDHVNDYSGKVDDIWLTNTLGVTFYSYGNTHGVRTIELDENDLADFQSESILFDQLVDHKPMNTYVANHGYYEYRHRLVPALIGSAAGVAVIAAAVVLITKVVKKKRKN